MSVLTSYVVGWLVLGFMADCLTRDLGQWVVCPPWGVLLRDPSPYLVSEKTTENSERLGRQARPGIEPGTSRLPVFERSYWWSQGRTVRHPCLIRDSNPDPQVQQLAFLTAAPFGRRIGVETKLQRDGHDSISKVLLEKWSNTYTGFHF